MIASASPHCGRVCAPRTYPLLQHVLLLALILFALARPHKSCSEHCNRPRTHQRRARDDVKLSQQLTIVVEQDEVDLDAVWLPHELTKVRIRVNSHS